MWPLPDTRRTPRGPIKAARDRNAWSAVAQNFRGEIDEPLFSGCFPRSARWPFSDQLGGGGRFAGDVARGPRLLFRVSPVLPNCSSRRWFVPDGMYDCGSSRTQILSQMHPYVGTRLSGSAPASMPPSAMCRQCPRQCSPGLGGGPCAQALTAPSTLLPRRRCFVAASTSSSRRCCRCLFAAGATAQSPLATARTLALGRMDPPRRQSPHSRRRLQLCPDLAVTTHDARCPVDASWHQPRSSPVGPVVDQHAHQRHQHAHQSHQGHRRRRDRCCPLRTFTFFGTKGNGTTPDRISKWRGSRGCVCVWSSCGCVNERKTGRRVWCRTHNANAKLWSHLVAVP